MSTKNKESEEVKAAPEGPEESPKAETLGESGSVTVYDKNGQKGRVYSRELHGDNFVELAKEFVSDREGWTVR